VDLGKAFNTVRHELLFELLEIYGILEDMIDVIRRLYKNVELKLNSNSAESTIPYSVAQWESNKETRWRQYFSLYACKQWQRPLKANGRQPISKLLTLLLQGHGQVPRTHTWAGLGYKRHNLQDQSYSLC
jgi:hypothetical protein